LRVVIADDSLVFRDRLRALLDELAGVQVVGQAVDGVEALALTRAARPEALILDVRMPRLDGLEVLRRLRFTSRRPVVIMLTNYPDPEYRARCLKLGARFFLDKATDLDQLPDVLSGLRRKGKVDGAKGEARA
jgi:two-component system nitrate/nitrite response regulator NarL